MKKEIIEFDVVFSNGANSYFYCQTLLEAFCAATLCAIQQGKDATIHHICYNRETIILPKLVFN